VANRDAQINLIMDKQNEAFRENSHALARLSESIEMRISREIRRESDERENQDAKTVRGEKI
jgi:hypothetical protein